MINGVYSRQLAMLIKVKFKIMLNNYSKRLIMIFERCFFLFSSGAPSCSWDKTTPQNIFHFQTVQAIFRAGGSDLEAKVGRNAKTFAQQRQQNT